MSSHSRKTVSSREWADDPSARWRQSITFSSEWETSSLTNRVFQIPPDGSTRVRRHRRCAPTGRIRQPELRRRQSGRYLPIPAGNLTGICGDVLTTLVLPSGWAWLLSVSRSRKNFSASMSVYSLRPVLPRRLVVEGAGPIKMVSSEAVLSHLCEASPAIRKIKKRQ